MNDLNVFTDLLIATTAVGLTPDSTRKVNEAVKLGNYTLQRFMTGKKPAEMVQGGDEITDFVYFDADAGREHYGVQSTFTYNNPQLLTQWTVSWVFTKAEMVYTHHEIGLNGEDYTDDARYTRYASLIDTKRMNLETANINGLEEDLWAVPDTTTMETSNGGVPYSIPASVNEFANGLPSAAHPGGVWTTVQGINPASQTGWVPRQQTYHEIGDISLATGDHLFQAMRRVFNQTHRGRLPRSPMYSDMESQPTFIATSNEGMVNFELCLQANQDTFVAAGRQDPAYNSPQFHGVPLDYVSELDTAAIFPTGTAGALDTELTTTNSNAGPRYFFLNTEYYLMAFHKRRFLYMLPPFSPSAQWFTVIQPCDTWHNNVNRARSRHGIVYPDETVVVTAAA